MVGSYVRSRGFLAVTSVAAGLAAGPARAADDGYANVFSSVLGAVGVISVERSPEIEYRERPPLVLPPGAQLPKPVPVGAKRTAAWPQDPDVAKRRKAAEDARGPLQALGAERNETVTKADLLKGRDSAAGGGGEPVLLNDCGSANAKTRHCLVMSPDELKREGEAFAAANPDKDLTLKAGVEPERNYLTQPPKGYMAPTRTVKATAEAPQPKVDDANPMSFLIPHPKTDE